LELYIDASLGKITSSTFWDRLGFKNNYPEIEISYLDQYLTLDKEFTINAEILKEKYNLALLSNDVSEWSLYLRQKHNLNRFFQEIVISGDVGFRKPSDEIYKILLERIGCNANDCVIVDDRHKNLVPAMKMGMKGIKFNREKTAADGAADDYKGFEIKSFIQLPNILPKVFA